MKSYPSIPYAVTSRLPIIAFDKLDGSNVRAEWSSKRGWYKFGTRHRLIVDGEPIFGPVPQLINEKYGEPLARAIHGAGFDRAVCFFELWGPGSFAGSHDPNESLTITLLDVAPYNQGILEPERFLRVCGGLDHARIPHWGPCTPEFIEQVRASELPEMTFEGVVCKAAAENRAKMPTMFKQKSRAWLEKLHEHCHGDQAMYSRLI